MNITFEKTDEVHGTLVANMEPDDYTKAYGKALRQNALRMQLPGFRPGKTPVSIVKRRFGEEILTETVSKMLSEALEKYIDDEKIPLLLQPVADEANAEVKIAEGGSFSFKFALALKPTFDFTLNSEDTLPYYDIEVAATTIDQQVEVFRRKGGSFEKVQDYQDNDMVKGTLTELDGEGNVLEGGIQVEEAILLPYILKNEEQKARFNGAKVGDVIVINPTEAYNGNETEVATFLHINKEEAQNHKGDFQLQLTEISRYVPGELTQKLFDEVFPGKNITSEEEFRQAIKQQIADQYTKETDIKFLVDLNRYAKTKVGNLTLPEDLLRKQIEKKEGQAPEEVDKEFARQIESLKWELIVEKLAEQYNLQVTAEDVVEGARDQVRDQYARYGMIGIDEAIVTQGASKLLSDRAQIEQMEFRCLNRMVASTAKTIVTLDRKSVTLEEFEQIIASQQGETAQE